MMTVARETWVATWGLRRREQWLPTTPIVCTLSTLVVDTSFQHLPHDHHCDSGYACCLGPHTRVRISTTVRNISSCHSDSDFTL